MVHPGKLSLAGFGIVSGGVLLGAALSAFANPVPKTAPPPAWNPMLHPPIAAGPSQAYYEPLPEDLSPRNLPDSYAPAFASGELSEWPVDFAMPPLEEWQAPSLALAEREIELGEDLQLAALDEGQGRIPRPALVEEVAQRALAAVQDAQEARAAPVSESEVLEEVDGFAGAAEPASTIPLASGTAKIISVGGNAR